MDIIKAFTSEQLKKDVPVFNIGNDVKVYCRIVEGERTRTQIFEGTRYRKERRRNLRDIHRKTYFLRCRS